MRTISASTARHKFGQLMDMVQTEPIRATKFGKDVAILISPADFQQLLGSADEVNPTVKRLHRRSTNRWAKAYQALAK